jgi:hypothetical protein
MTIKKVKLDWRMYRFFAKKNEVDFLYCDMCNEELLLGDYCISLSYNCNNRLICEKCAREKNIKTVKGSLKNT